MTTPRDPLAAALRDALASERTSPEAHADDDALIARAVARATTALTAAPATATASSTATARGETAAKDGGTAKTSRAAKAGAPAAKTAATESARLSALTARPRTRLLRVMLPLAAAFAASIAVAAVYVSSQSTEPPPSSSTEAPLEPAPPEPGPQAKTTTMMPAEAKTEPSVSVHDLPSAKTLAAVTSDTVAFSPPPHADSPVTAAELFRDANTQRRANELGKAVDLYKTLQRRFPDAPETQASRVSLGRLLLDRQGDAAGALAQFDAYLAGAQSDGGTLAEEARLGRALAFEKLGRKDDEQRAWEELLARHPQSLHGSRARERLGVLGSER
ncbi:MAG: tetratricopeptide repeat protein [Labilithrix sp.]|nr:tetratricopeptide repeat protein [Labilithrix sp.]